MATKPHPVTGVLMNDIHLVRHGRVTEDERRTAQLLLADGHPRWLVAAMLGRFPLAFDGTGRAPADARRARGGHLSARAAQADPRQAALFEDLFGPEPGEPAA